MYSVNFIVTGNKGYVSDIDNAFSDEKTKNLYKEFTDEYGSIKELADSIGNKVMEKEPKLQEFFEELHTMYLDVTDDLYNSVKNPSISICLIITNDEEIRLYNSEYRNIDSSTDVLSFPTVHYESPGVPMTEDEDSDVLYVPDDPEEWDYDDLDEDLADYESDIELDEEFADEFADEFFGILESDFEETDDIVLDNYTIVDPESGDIVFGDMAISFDHAKAQSVEYGHSFKREVAFLIAHSMLHLCGYDHEEESDARIMEEKQESILKELGILRDGD